MSNASRARKIFDWITGLFLIALGIAGLVLPGLPGIVLILAGLAVLSSHSAMARRIRELLMSRARQARDRWFRRDPS